MMSISPSGAPSCLVVDDHVDSATTLAKLLELSGVRVRIAYDCRGALEHVAHERFDVVLCDIGLPDGDGCALMKELRKVCDTPGIAVTAHVMPHELARVRAAGFAEQVVKPYDFSAILDAIARVCPGFFPNSPQPPV